MKNTNVPARIEAEERYQVRLVSQDPDVPRSQWVPKRQLKVGDVGFMSYVSTPSMGTWYFHTETRKG